MTAITAPDKDPEIASTMSDEAAITLARKKSEEILKRFIKKSGRYSNILARMLSKKDVDVTVEDTNMNYTDMKHIHVSPGTERLFCHKNTLKQACAYMGYKDFTDEPEYEEIALERIHEALLVHETLHCIYTNTRYSVGNKTTLSPVQQKIGHMIGNIIEDRFIENIVSTDGFKGFGENILFLNAMLYFDKQEKCAGKEEPDPEKPENKINAFLSYAAEKLTCPMSAAEMPESIKPELEKAMPIFFSAAADRKCENRLYNAPLEILKIISPWLEEIDQKQKEQEKQRQKNQQNGQYPQEIMDRLKEMLNNLQRQMQMGSMENNTKGHDPLYLNNSEGLLMFVPAHSRPKKETPEKDSDSKQENAMQLPASQSSDGPSEDSDENNQDPDNADPNGSSQNHENTPKESEKDGENQNSEQKETTDKCKPSKSGKTENQKEQKSQPKTPKENPADSAQTPEVDLKDIAETAKRSIRAMERSNAQYAKKQQQEYEDSVDSKTNASCSMFGIEGYEDYGINLIKKANNNKLRAYNAIVQPYKALISNYTDKFRQNIRCNTYTDIKGKSYGYKIDSRKLLRKDKCWIKRGNAEAFPDIQATIMVDQSGSMNWMMGAVIKSCAVMAEIFEKLNIPYAIAGHSVRRNNAVDITLLKEFDQPKNKTNILDLYASGGTINGIPLVWTNIYSSKYARHDTKEIIIFISDGGSSDGKECREIYNKLKKEKKSVCFVALNGCVDELLEQFPRSAILDCENITDLSRHLMKFISKEVSA